MEDSLNVRFDELEQELIRLLSLRADDLQLFSSRQDQLLQSHYHSLTSTLQTARTQLERTKGNSGALHKQEIRERWIERQNLKRFWVYCEEIQRQKQQDMIGNCSYLDRVEEAASNSVYQTPNQNDSTTNISTTSLIKMSENNKNHSQSSESYSASQPMPEIFSDATGRYLNSTNNPESPTKTYSNSQPEPSVGILKKSRKSLGNGRRVSFAATAHVRVFGNAEKRREAEAQAAAAAEEEEEAEEERQLERFRKQFENNVDDLKNSLNEFEIKSSPINFKSSSSNSMLTPSKRTFATVDQSFDVDLKVDEQPSFSSYLSPEKDMDLTGCVGNILDDLSSPMSVNSRRQSQMEFTNCVGSILAQISKNTAVHDEDDEEDDINNNSAGNEDMEMTQSIGSLVVNVPALIESVDSLNSQNSDNMEMTQPIGSLIVQSQPEQPGRTGQNSVSTPAAVADPIDVSFIEDCVQPAAFNLAGSMSPPKLNEEAAPNSSKSGSQLSKIAYEAGREDGENVRIMEISEKVDQESIKIAKEAVEMASEQMFQAFSIHNQTQIQQAQSMSATSTAAQASLKEFLNETGVRFLDNLSNMGRRETIGKPRDSQIITPARRTYIRNVLIPETVAVEKACTECVRTIEAQRQFLVEEEGKFNHHPPLAFREFLKNPTESVERSVILQKLKTLKSVARLFARQSWYEWRKGFETNFQGELSHVLSTLKNDYGTLETERFRLQQVSSEQIDPKLETLTKDLSHLKARYESLSRSDWEEASQLHEVVMVERQKSVELDSELTETLSQEASLRQNIEMVLEQRRQLQDRLTGLKHACAQFEDCTELALTELKSTFALQEALNGWRMVQVREDSFTWEYTRGTPTSPVRIRMMTRSPSLSVTSVLIESDTSSLPTLRPASQLIQPEFIDLPRSMTLILGQLDSLVQLSRELSLIKVQCDVQLLPVVPGPQLPLLLTFFNYDAKIKFDVIIGSSLNPAAEMAFQFLSFSSHYGPIKEDQIRNVIKEDGSSLRRIVNNISSFLK